MTNDINFLVIKNEEAAKKKKGVKILRIVSGFSLAVVAILTIVSFYLNNKIYPKSLKNEYDSLLKSMSTLHNKEAKLAIVNNRVGNISDLVGKNTDYAKIVGKFSEKFSAGIKVDSLRIDKKTITLIASSNSLSPINEFIDGLIDLGRDKTIKILTLDSLSVNDTSGMYSVALTGNL